MIAIAKHAPGPWRYDDSMSSRFSINAGPYIVADVVRSQGDESIANARLIAAAPDLLIACQAAGRFLDGLFFLGGKTGEDEAQQLVEQLRLAVQRAMEGRA